MFEVGTLRDTLRSIVTKIDAEQYSGADATSMMKQFAEIETLAAAGKALFAKRAREANAHTTAGFSNPTGWIAGQLGITPAEAADSLRVGDAMENDSAIGDAVRNGEVSSTEAAAVAKGAEVDRQVGRNLLNHAKKKTKTARELQEEARKAQAQQRSDDEVRKRLFAKFTPQASGGVMLAALFDTATASRIKTAALSRADELFNIARKEGRREPSAAYLSDAIADLICGDVKAKAPGKREAHIRVDSTALKRGSTEPGETCEIAGVGPISVRTARELMDECILKVLVTNGIDVLTVTSLSRYVPDVVDVAISERDFTCVVPGCDMRVRLQNDHFRKDFAKLGPTEYENLARLCVFHHRLKTHRGFRLERDDGNWVWIPPNEPKRPKRKKKKRPPEPQRDLWDESG